MYRHWIYFAGMAERVPILLLDRRERRLFFWAMERATPVSFYIGSPR